MGKLVFKGDTTTKKKKKDRLEPQVENAAKKLDLEDVSGWTTALSESDLNGPCIIAMVLDGQKGLIRFDPDSDSRDLQFQLTRNYKIALKVINFLGEDSEIPEHHKFEPSTSLQTFTISSVKIGNEKKYSFKTATKYYLAIDPENSNAITKPTIDTFSLFDLIPYSVNSNGISEHLWQIVSNGKSLHYVGDKFKFTDTLNKTGFLIRIHIQNLKQYKIIQLSIENESKKDIKIILKELYKDTKGKAVIDESLVKRIKQSIIEGNLHEQIIAEKNKVSSRW